MIDVGEFFKILTRNGFDFYAGVPDSLLKDFCAYLIENVPASRNIITANEGGAVALCSGYHLGTGKIGLVYMQNSGIGNAVNPLLSLNDPLVYGIPVLLVIGWRGEPGVKDEPQHQKQGSITLDLLNVLGIPYKIISSQTNNLEGIIKHANDRMKKTNIPYALVVKKGSFKTYKPQNNAAAEAELTRETALKLVVSHIDKKAVIISTTGKLSRELYEYREETGISHAGDFLTVGSMGHVSHIAAGLALARADIKVYCFDGDGAFLMHMGSTAINAHLPLHNYFHIVFNNGSHDSVGGQPTVGRDVMLHKIALAAGFKNAFIAGNEKEIIKALTAMKSCAGPVLLEIIVKKGARTDLGRPGITPTAQKIQFMKYISK